MALVWLTSSPANQLIALSPELGKMTSLQKLYLGRNRIGALLPEIGFLTGAMLAFCNSHLAKAHAHIPHAGLRELHLKGNRLKDIPKEMSALVQLKHLDLSTNEFQTFPDSDNFPPAINFLNMSDNQVPLLHGCLNDLF